MLQLVGMDVPSIPTERARRRLRSLAPSRKPAAAVNDPPVAAPGGWWARWLAGGVRVSYPAGPCRPRALLGPARRAHQIDLGRLRSIIRHRGGWARLAPASEAIGAVRLVSRCPSKVPPADADAGAAVGGQPALQAGIRAAGVRRQPGVPPIGGGASDYRLAAARRRARLVPSRRIPLPACNPAARCSPPIISWPRSRCFRPNGCGRRRQSPMRPGGAVRRCGRAAGLRRRVRAGGVRLRLVEVLGRSGHRPTRCSSTR